MGAISELREWVGCPGGSGPQPQIRRGPRVYQAPDQALDQAAPFTLHRLQTFMVVSSSTLRS